MPHRLPESSPVRVYLNGVLQSAPAPGQGPAKIVRTADALAAGRQAPPAAEPLRLDVTRAWVHGVPQELTRQPAPAPAPAPVPTMTPMRINGVAVEPSASQGSTLTTGQVQRQWQEAQRAENMRQQQSYRTPQELAAIQERENAWAKCFHYREQYGLQDAFIQGWGLPPEESTTDASAAPGAPDHSPPP